MTRALIVVDVQNDFCEGGSLAVAGGNSTAINIANHIRGIDKMDSGFYDYIVATKDDHDFGDNGGHFGYPPDFVDSWPDHCVHSTPGAEFHPEIKDVEGFLDEVFYKGAGEPAYSGFQGSTADDVSLDIWLRNRHVTDLIIVGIATDYCVKATALDALDLGYKVRVPLMLTAAVGGPEAKSKALFEIDDKAGNFTL